MNENIPYIMEQYLGLKDCKGFDSKTFYKQFSSEEHICSSVQKTRPFLFEPEKARFFVTLGIAKCSHHSEI